MATTQMRRNNVDGSRSVIWGSGWTVFAAIMMIFGGTMSVFQGVAAIAKDNVFVTTRNYTYKFDLTSWGWIHLVLGALVVLAGLALFRGALWARVIGIALAGLSMIANFMWLPYYPLWAIVLVAVDAFIIWALSVGGSREARAR